jgi:hypothetical protein
MKEKPKRDKASEASPPDHLLARIPSGEFDSKLPQTPSTTSAPTPSQSPEHVEGLGGLSRGKRAGTTLPPEAAATRQPAVPASPPAEDELPEGAIIAMRRSGGLRFTTKRVVIYQDGRVVMEGSLTPGESRRPRPRKLRDKELAELYRALEHANFSALPHISGLQSPDAYAYEIVARDGDTTHSVEVFEGSIPEQLKPLIQVLSTYMKGSE